MVDVKLSALDELKKLQGVWIGPQGNAPRRRLFVVTVVEHRSTELGLWAELFSVTEDSLFLLRVGGNPGQLELLSDDVLRDIVIAIVLGPSMPVPGYCSGAGSITVDVSVDENRILLTPCVNGQFVVELTTRTSYRQQGDELLLIGPLEDPLWRDRQPWIYKRRKTAE